MIAADVCCDRRRFHVHSSLVMLYFHQASKLKTPMFKCLSDIDSAIRELFDAIDSPMPEKMIGGDCIQINVVGCV
jgi:hypothetical protein